VEGFELKATLTQKMKKDKKNVTTVLLTSATEITENENILFVILQSINASTNGHSSADWSYLFVST